MVAKQLRLFGPSSTQSSPPGITFTHRIRNLEYVLVIMFVLILGATQPCFRAMSQDYFEPAHLFSGWTALVVLWSHNGFAVCDSTKQEGISTALFTARSPNFWFFCASVPSIKSAALLDFFSFVI